MHPLTHQNYLIELHEVWWPQLPEHVKWAFLLGGKTDRMFCPLKYILLGVSPFPRQSQVLSQAGGFNGRRFPHLSFRSPHHYATSVQSR